MILRLAAEDVRITRGSGLQDSAFAAHLWGVSLTAGRPFR